jgi:hypothetical protein
MDVYLLGNEGERIIVEGDVSPNEKRVINQHQAQK